METMIGQIVLFAFRNAPDGFLACDGRFVPIAPYQFLFQVIGTTYGGDGRTHFALPDLRGRIPIHRSAPGDPTPFPLGAKGGTERVVLNADEIAPHAHALSAASAVPAEGASPTPSASVIFASAGQLTPYAASVDGATPVTMASAAIAPAGPPAEPHDNMMPTLFMNYCIAHEGVMPA